MTSGVCPSPPRKTCGNIFPTGLWPFPRKRLSAFIPPPGPPGGRRPFSTPPRTWRPGPTWWPAACTWPGCAGRMSFRTWWDTVFSPGGLGFQYGAERLGALTIPSGSGNSKRQIALMRDFGTTVIHIIPSYALHLWKVFEEMDLDPEKGHQAAHRPDRRRTPLGCHPAADRGDVRGEAFNSYGLSEMNGPGVAFECPEKSGMHFWEDDFYVEVIDPKTAEGPSRMGRKGSWSSRP